MENEQTARRLIHIATNAAKAADVQRITHSDGREYLVAPDIPLVQGVMNGVLYLEEEVAAYLAAWNGKPLTLGHPQNANGDYISANSPDQFAISPGTFFNATWDKGRLKGEWWIDIEKANEIGGDAITVMERLENGELIEESTGLYADEEMTSGIYNGVSYQSIARNIRPDHLAILLNETGACSIEDGCGAPRVNKDKSMNGIEVNIALSLSEQENRVYEAFYGQFSGPNCESEMWVRDVFPAVVIARSGEKLFAYPYQVNEQSEIAFGDPVEVMKAYLDIETEQPVNNQADEDTPPVKLDLENDGEPQVNQGLFNKVAQAVLDRLGLSAEALNMEKRQAIVNRLTEGGIKLSQSVLEAASLEDLEAIESGLQTNNENAEGEETVDEEVTDVTPEATVELPEGLTELLAVVDEHGGVQALRESLGTLQTNSDQERQNLIGRIVTNCGMEESELSGLGVTQLQSIADAVDRPTTPDYSGRGAIVNRAGDTAYGSAWIEEGE